MTPRPPRVRARFAKRGKVRFVSHRDLARIWERALRKAGVPVTYSEGFSPRPRVSFGLALPTGYESDAEYLDVTLVEPVPVDQDWLDRLSEALPTGIDALAAVPLEPGTTSLQEAVVATDWSLPVVGAEAPELARATEALLASDSHIVTRTRKGKQVTDDLRPAVEALAVVDDEAAPVLEAQLATRERSLRPAELVSALAGLEDTPDDTWHIGRARRRTQWIECDGHRREPLALTGPLAAHALERAS